MFNINIRIAFRSSYLNYIFVVAILVSLTMMDKEDGSLNFIREVMLHDWTVYGPALGEEMLFENMRRMRQLLAVFIREFHLEASDFEYFRYNCGYDLWIDNDGERKPGEWCLELAKIAKNDSAIKSLKEFMNPDFHQSLSLEGLVVTTRPARNESDLEKKSFLRETMEFAWQICKPPVKKPMHWRRKAQMINLLDGFILCGEKFEIDDFQYLCDSCGFHEWTRRETGQWYRLDEAYLTLAIQCDHLTARDSFLAMMGRPDMGKLFVGKRFEWDVKGVKMVVECTSFNDGKRFITICEYNPRKGMSGYKVPPHWRINYDLLEANKIE